MASLQGSEDSSMDGASHRDARSVSGPHSVGEALRRRREALRLEFDEVAAALRIKPRYLAALEAGCADQLPGYAYAVGFVRAYADYLGLDASEVLRRFKEGPIGLPEKPDLSLLMPLGERRIPGATALLTAALLAICGYGIWHYLLTAETDRLERVTPVPAELLAHTVAAPPAFGTSAPTDQAVLRPDSAAPPAASMAPAEPAPRDTPQTTKRGPLHKH